MSRNSPDGEAHARRMAAKTNALGGVVAAARFDEAMNALHTYAQASGCPPGMDVTDWYRQRMVECEQAMREANRK